MHIFIFFAVPQGFSVASDAFPPINDTRGPRWQVSISLLIIKSPWTDMGQSESGISHLSLIWRCEQIDFTQKVIFDSDSQCRGDRNLL